jgi:hypothetical protein
VLAEFAFAVGCVLFEPQFVWLKTSKTAARIIKMDFMTIALSQVNFVSAGVIFYAKSGGESIKAGRECFGYQQEML